jgi:hypothetical protein
MTTNIPGVKKEKQKKYKRQKQSESVTLKTHILREEKPTTKSERDGKAAYKTQKPTL